MRDEFSRTELLIGREALGRLHAAKVAVFGIGGVGSFAVEGLARAGVGRFVLIDGDCVCPTNINRQLIATHETIGKPKVEVMCRRILEINPEAEVTVHQVFYTPDTAEELIREDYDYIVDAIDMVSAKIDLVARAKEKGIPVISSMGAGNKLDPTRFEVADIYDTSVCPLAKVMRRELKKRGVRSLKVVYSKENPIKPMKAEGAGCGADCACAGETTEESIDGRLKYIVRRQIPGSISFVPSVAGLIIAGEVVRDLVGYSPK